MTMTRKSLRKPSTRTSTKAPILALLSRDERVAAGKALRDTVPRERHAAWKQPTGRRDPIDVLEESKRGRVAELIPIRYGRMLRSPFTFLRGSAGLMAHDLRRMPAATVITVAAAQVPR